MRASGVTRASEAARARGLRAGERPGEMGGEQREEGARRGEEEGGVGLEKGRERTHFFNDDVVCV